MHTLRELLIDKIEFKQDALAQAESNLVRVPVVLLDLVVPPACHRVWMFTRTEYNPQLEIMYETATLEEQREIVAFLMDTLGMSTATREEDANNRNAVTFLLGDAGNRTKIFVNRPSDDCNKRARIVEERTIVFCGDLDESKYLEVEYLGNDKDKDEEASA